MINKTSKTSLEEKTKQENHKINLEDKVKVPKWFKKAMVLAAVGVTPIFLGGGLAYFSYMNKGTQLTPESLETMNSINYLAASLDKRKKPIRFSG